MSYLSIAQTKGHWGYFVFRGTTLAADGVTTTPVVWPSVDLATAAGAAKKKLLNPGIASRGLPETIGGAVEDVNLTMTLDDSDQGLKSFLIGTAGSDALLEYRADSLLNLFGNLFHGVVDPVTGASAEIKLTPPLALSGPAFRTENQIQLPMSSRHDQVIGSTYHRWTVGDLKNGTFDYDGSHDVSGTGAFADSTGSSGAYSSAAADLADWGKSLEAAAPFLLGQAGIPLILTTDLNGNLVSALAGISMVEPDISDFANWKIQWGDAEGLSQEQAQTFAFAVKTKRWVQDASPQRNWVAVWILYVEAYFVGRSRGAGGDYANGPIYLFPTARSLGVQAPGGPSTEAASPSNIVRRLVIDHSTGGAAGIDATSFAAVHAAMMETVGMAGGFYDGRSPISEILTHIADAFGLDFFLGTDGTLRVSAHASWGVAAAALLAAGGLPELRLADVYADWREEVPFGQGRLGTCASLTTVDWTAEQKACWTVNNLPESAAGGQAVPLGRTIEARVSGAWVYPPKAATALALYASRSLYPTRRISFRTHMWVASYELGQIFLVTHPRGLEAAGANGYQRRPMRLERLQIDPTQYGVLVTLEDLGPISRVLAGQLDDYANWIAKTPSANSLTLTAASSTVAASANIFDATDVGRTLVTRGAVGSDGNAYNRRITGFVDAKHVTVDVPYDHTETIAAAGAGIDATWLVVDNHNSKGAAFRSGYIRAAKESTGKFGSGDQGYSYTGAT